MTLNELRDVIPGDAQEMEIYTRKFTVLMGTGEIEFGRDGGTACVAYLTRDVMDLDVGGIKTYADLCAALTPETDHEIAIALVVVLDYRLVDPTTRLPVLNDGAYNVIYRAVDLALKVAKGRPAVTMVGT